LISPFEEFSESVHLWQGLGRCSDFVDRTTVVLLVYSLLVSSLDVLYEINTDKELLEILQQKIIFMLMYPERSRRTWGSGHV